MSALVLASSTRRRFLKTGLTGAAAIALYPALPARAAALGRLLAGAARRRVTPPLFVPYLTSSANGTHAPFKAVHDDLFARALVLDDGRQQIAVLSVDSIGYDNSILGKGRDFTRELRRRIARRTGLSANSIMLAATHAHSTPETIGLTAVRDVRGVPEWLDNHLQELAETVVDAWNNRTPVIAFAGTVRVEGVARCRRILLKNGKLSVHGALPPSDQVATPWQLDEDLNVLHFQRDDGSACAVMLNYTAHPVIAMLLPEVSADYPGAVSKVVEERLPGAVCLFTQGAAGNVNSLKVSTCFDDVAAIGLKLGEAALARIAEFRGNQPLKDPKPGVCSCKFRLEPRECPSVFEAIKRASATAPTSEGRVTRLALKLDQGPLAGELQAMRLGPVRWISFPGEPFVETGLAFKEAGANFVVGYANGYLGYFPTRNAYSEGGYEVVQGAWSRVAPGSAERLEARGKELLQRLR